MIFDPIMSLINGLRTKVGNATLTTTAQDLSGGVNELNDQKANQTTFAKVENGATATQTINIGDFVYRNGILYQYRGSSAIATGATIPAFSDSWIIPYGGLNFFQPIEVTPTPGNNCTFDNLKVFKYGQLCIMQGYLNVGKGGTPVAHQIIINGLPSPAQHFKGTIQKSDNGGNYQIAMYKTETYIQNDYITLPQGTYSVNFIYITKI